MKKIFKKAIVLAIVSAMVISMFPMNSSAYSFTGQDYNSTSDIKLFGVDTGADYTRVHLGSGGSSGWGANRYINIVEANLSRNDCLSFEVINHGSSLMGSAPLPSVVSSYNEENNTILAAVNGDWMSYAKSIGVPVTKNYRVSFSSMLLDGEIWCSQMSSQEQNADYYTFGVSKDRDVLIGKPSVSTTIRNVSTGRSISATGVNRAPANNGLYVYNNRMGSFNYVPSDAYEIAISTSSNKFMNCGTVTGTVKGIYPSGTSSRCALDDNTVIITARGSKISTIKGYFSVGQTVSISTKLTASSNSSFWANCEEAIGGQCLVMQNGSITNDLGASVGANSHQYPTSILGYKSDGTVMMTMVTSDSNGNYVGLRFNRIPDFCRAVGYDTCLLLDGGGSTTMVTLENGSYVERACYSDGVIRYVWNSLALVYTDAGVVPNSLKSVVFDATYYANNNADLKAAFGNDAAKLYNHFLDFGIKEGRQASPNFSIKYYTEANSDLKAAFGTDYVKAMKHFVEFGKNEVRKTAPPADIGNNVDFRINVNGLAVGLSGTNVVTATKAINASEIWTFIKNADDGTYTIKNKTTGKVLDVHGAGKTAGTNVQTYDGNGTNAQRWYLYDRKDGSFVIQPKCSTTCVLDVSGGSTKAGANIQIYTNNGSAAQKYSLSSISKVENFVSSSSYVNLGNEFYAQITGVGSGKNLADVSSSLVLADNAMVPAQLWKFVRYSDGSYKIVNQASGKVIDVYGGYDASGTKVQTYVSNDSNAQRWYLYSTENGYIFLPKNSTSNVLDVVMGANVAGTNLQIYTFNETTAQKFNVTKVSGDYMDTIGSTTIGTGFYANIAVGSQSLGVSGTNVQLVNTSKSSSSQTWKFDLQSDGTYKITHKATGKVLDVSNASDADFANVQIYDSNNTRAQRWYVYQKEGKFIIRSAVSKTRVLDVFSGNIATGSNISIYTRNYSNAQMFSINKV